MIGWKNISGIDYWICPNSWGSWNGNNGIFYLPFNYSQAVFYYIVSEVTPVRPYDFGWTLPKVQGEEYISYASEWMAFVSRIKQFMDYKGVLTGRYDFTNAVSGNPFTATIFNQARNAISLMASTSVPSVVSGDVVFASYFNDLVSSLNSIS